MTKQPKSGRTRGGPGQKRKIVHRSPVRSHDVPATMEVVFSVRDELKHEIASVRTELKDEIASVRTELKAEIESVRTELKADIASLRTEFSELKAEFKTFETTMCAQMEKNTKEITSAIHQIKILFEEQNARNKYVLDGYTSLYDRQDRVEREVRELRLLITDSKKES